jgi:molybdate transport system permease protein
VEWEPLILSFEVAAVATLFTTVIGVWLATILANRRFRGRELLDIAITIPMVMPPTVLGWYVVVAIGKESFIGRSYEWLFGRRIVFSFTGAVIAAIIGSLPLIVKSARTALEGVDPNLLKAARTLGANSRRVFFTVQLPLAAPGVLAGVMLGFAHALGNFGLTLMIAGNIPGETRTASLAIYDAIQANRRNDALLMIAVLSAFAILTLYVVAKLTRKPHED